MIALELEADMANTDDPSGTTDPRLSDHLRGLGRGLSRGAQNAYGRVIDVAAPPIERVQDVVKEQPLTSVVVAAVTGAMLNRLGTRRRRRW